MNRNPPTMKDVAQAAGVSLGTVSKVFNGIPVGEPYRRKVEAAAKALGYQVNHYARGLRTNRTNSVAVILPGVNHPFFGTLAQALCESLLRRDYRMLLYVTSSDPAAEERCMRMVRQNKADGIIGLTYTPGLTVDVPFISIDRSCGTPCVASDNFGGGRLAAEKLIGLGCERLAFLRTGSAQLGEVDKRGEGFLAACRAHGMEPGVLSVNDDQPMGVFRDFLCAHLHGGRLDYDGIFCVTDLLAYRVRGMLEELGVRVPEEVQIIGFDGVRWFETEERVCSTIVQPIAQIAETSVDLLLNKPPEQLPALVCLPVSYAPGGTTREEV